MNNNLKNLIEELTLEEKAKMLCGYKTMETFPIERLNIPPLVLSDGPIGLRKEDVNGNSLGGIANTLPTTCFPSGVSLASTWDKNLIYDVGRAIGEECNHYGVNVILGPAINIKRNPKCGRNFEYYSEDPLISGVLGAEFIKGVQSKNVGATPKHFACNNNEKYRFVGDSVVDQRALREIYLKPFEIAIKKAKPYAIMNAYNKVNGIYCSENEQLMNDILRDEWGFEGLSMTDWGGIVNRDLALENGTDLEMPGMVFHNVKLIINAVKNGSLKIEVVNKAVERLLNVISKTKLEENLKCDFEKNYELAIKVSEASGVLLENDGILPLRKDSKYLVIGDLFRQMRYQGSGSALINPYKLSSHINAFNQRDINYKFVRGYIESENSISEDLENEALEIAKDADYIIFYGGQNDYMESEGFDRESLCLPHNQLSLINKLSLLGKKMVLVLFGGSCIEMPFKESFNAILYMGLPGEGGGEATTKLLFGEVTPSGRLTETWPIKYDDVPFASEFTESPVEKYKESIYVGYRYYQTAQKRVLYPFGYGLSYSSFEYSNLVVDLIDNEILLKIKVKNIGNIQASEVLQVYTSKKESSVYRPIKELKAFAKVLLKPNEEKEVKISLDINDLKIYNINSESFMLEDGEYIIEVAKNVETAVLKSKVQLKGELIKSINSDIIDCYYKNIDNLLIVDDSIFEQFIGYQIPIHQFNKRPYTLETPIGEFETFIGKIFKIFACNVGLKQYKKACKKEESLERERQKKAGLFVYKMMPYNSLRSICYSSSGKLPYNMAKGILELANGHLIKGLKLILKKEKP